MEKLFTTAQAAKQMGISRQSLQTWISAGIVQPPPKRGGNVRLWTSGEVAKAVKIARGRKAKARKVSK
jgi:predicted site-specific integrase-resolvase